MAAVRRTILNRDEKQSSFAPQAGNTMAGGKDPRMISRYPGLKHEDQPDHDLDAREKGLLDNQMTRLVTHPVDQITARTPYIVPGVHTDGHGDPTTA